MLQEEGESFLAFPEGLRPFLAQPHLPLQLRRFTANGASQCPVPYREAKEEGGKERGGYACVPEIVCRELPGTVPFPLYRLVFLRRYPGETLLHHREEGGIAFPYGSAMEGPT